MRVIGRDERRRTLVEVNANFLLSQRNWAYKPPPHRRSLLDLRLFPNLTEDRKQHPYIWRAYEELNDPRPTNGLSSRNGGTCMSCTNPFCMTMDLGAFISIVISMSDSFSKQCAFCRHACVRVYAPSLFLRCAAPRMPSPFVDI